MVEKITYLIIGNGIAGITAAEILRVEDPTATIGIIADEPFPVYYRPALKDYLAGRITEEKLWARPDNFYQEHKIHFLPAKVVGVQAQQHLVQLESGSQVHYRKLLLAGGSHAVRLNCPGADLQGVFTLRTVADYQAIVERLPLAQHIIVCGGGTLALETVETLRQRQHPVTHLVRGQRLWSEVLDETASDLVLQQVQRDGVAVHLDEEIVKIEGDHGEITHVVTRRGNSYPCDLLLLAIGVEPNIGFLRHSSVSCWRGVHVDQHMQTSAQDIYAAGDIVETVDTHTKRTRVIGQWYPAIQQARAAAYSMLTILDTQHPFAIQNFYNATCLYKLHFAAAGKTNLSGYEALVADPQPKSYRKVLLKDDYAVGFLFVGDRRQALAFKRAIDHQVNLGSVREQLLAEDFQLGEWLDQKGVPPPLLGANRLNGVSEPAQRRATEVSGPTVKTLEEIMDKAQASLGPGEALLVQLPDATDLHLPEMVLYQNASTLIGRQAGVHLLIDEPTVSRQHAEIQHYEDKYLLYDLGSSNGTYLNGTRLVKQQPYLLSQQDEIRIGLHAHFRFLQRTPLPVQSRAVRAVPSDPLSDTILHRTPDLKQALSAGRPVLNQDGSLLPPGSKQALPAQVVATFKEVPALIIFPEAGSKQAPKVHLLKAGKKSTLGRETGNDIELLDGVASRRHAEIAPGPDGGLYIRDLNSSNGVMVNQIRIQAPQRLVHGDQIMLGCTTMLFVDLQAGKEQTEKLLIPFKETTRNTGTRAGSIPTAALVSAPVPQAAAPDIVQQMVICRYCGVVNMPIARFCASCSRLLHQTS
ncbi:FAD-dependent oxidoreductase [Tengunoibacter tsumagoiensis]|uniref:FHA domain-containing protein n=1 Tax=Tengunoibacter tsumagoiensis TaxID=2014871 RepID=A0A401ZVG0_9CHLR|nr:FAD-dependent oxidoreductase [Tengunoibacter tsumagoiensis]GCE10782.1 hypothetical protein KTT_06410 [Tengunoibacter tsumagoiensis]